MFLVAIGLAWPCIAGGIQPAAVNQIIIEGRFAEAMPEFLVLFSSKPLRDGGGALQTAATPKFIAGVGKSRDCVGIRLYGKPATKPGRFDYLFGTRYDADRPWNNGKDFRWQDWATVSPDIWHNVAIVALPPKDRSSRPSGDVITNVVIRRGGNRLYDSRAKKSYPNGRQIDVSLKPFSLGPQQDGCPLLNLAERMERFRNDYFELAGNPILQCAFADLGQTDETKYCKPGKKWCSEFTSYVFRQNGYATPDPTPGTLSWKGMRKYFLQHGTIYSLREVAKWSNEEKIAKIKPGSYLSIRVGQPPQTHSLLFTTWIVNGHEPITQYAAVSGNSRKMVRVNAPLTLPLPADFKAMSPEQLAEYDQRVFFGILPNRNAAAQAEGPTRAPAGASRENPNSGSRRS